MCAMSVKVLVVDDDSAVREVLVSTLRFSGYDVDEAVDSISALDLLGRTTYDAVVLDVMMPGMDGFELVQLLRRRSPHVPVLFLSGRDAVEDRVRGLRLGADDYVVKPFSAVEISARIDALVRRAGGTAEPGNILRCADLTVDLDRFEVERDGTAVSLSPTEFRVLQVLIEHQGRVLSKDQLLEHVWGYDFGGDTNVVERFVSNLRRKLDDDRPALIRTVRGFGYTLRAPGA
jgi:two-component system OmpR family response regulator